MLGMNFKIFYLCVCFLANIVFGENATKTKVKSIRDSLAAEVFKSSLETQTNTVVGILPLQFAFCKLASVASGKVKQELLKALGFKNESLIHTFFKQFQEIPSWFENTDLMYLNNMYVDNNKPLKSTFIPNSLPAYGVFVSKIGFDGPMSAATLINKEISSKTLRRVENIVGSNNITNGTSLLLVTAAHCKPTWETPFDFKLTKTRTFQLLNNRRLEIPMMVTAQSCLLFDAKDFRVIKVHLVHPGVSILFIQPSFLTLDKIILKMQDPAFMKNIKKRMTHRFVRIVLPRIKIKSQISLNEYLEKLGIKEVLSKNTTGLNSILNQEVATNMFVSNVLQKFFIEMDEFGVTRIDKSARYGHGNEPRRDPPAQIEVVFERPFYFSINLEVTPDDPYKHTEPTADDIYELFAGVYYQPDDAELYS